MAHTNTLPELWDMLQAAENNHSLLKQELTRQLYEELKDKKTKRGGTLADCIRTGCENPDSLVGIHAPEPEGYTVFAPLMDRIIKSYHKVTSINHPPADFGDPNSLGDDLDPSKKMILSTRVRVGRAHDGFGFPPVLTKEDRLNMEKITKDAFSSLEGELKGDYYTLGDMSDEMREKLIATHYLFKTNNRFLRSSSAHRDWPSGRGIFFNPSKTFLVWVNEGDHMRIISMQSGGNLTEVYGRLVRAVRALGEKIKFAHKEGFGFLSFCPTNLGTSLRASVHIKIPNLSGKQVLTDLCNKYNLQPRGIDGEHTAPGEGGVYDISNKRRLGLTEIEAITEMRDGVKAIIQKEKELAGEK